MEIIIFWFWFVGSTGAGFAFMISAKQYAQNNMVSVPVFKILGFICGFFLWPAFVVKNWIDL